MGRKTVPEAAAGMALNNTCIGEMQMAKQSEHVASQSRMSRREVIERLRKAAVLAVPVVAAVALNPPRAMGS